MSHTYIGANAPDRDAAGMILDKAHALPVPGVHVGRGPHVDMPATWDGNGPVPIGWTSFQAHRNGVDEIWLPEPETASKLARLTGPERAALAQIRAAAHAHGPATPVIAARRQNT